MAIDVKVTTPRGATLFQDVKDEDPERKLRIFRFIERAAAFEGPTTVEVVGEYVAEKEQPFAFRPLPERRWDNRWPLKGYGE